MLNNYPFERAEVIFLKLILNSVSLGGRVNLHKKYAAIYGLLHRHINMEVTGSANSCLDNQIKLYIGIKSNTNTYVLYKSFCK